MRIECPKNSKHKTFKTKSAHVQQEWLVNEDGCFMKTIDECLEVDHEPDDKDLYECSKCGSYAIVKSGD